MIAQLQSVGETYDANGNVTSTGVMSYTYDSENHMLTASGNGKSISMIGDGVPGDRSSSTGREAFGNRVAKTVNGVTTQYLVEDDVNPTGYPQVIEELTGPLGAGAFTDDRSATISRHGVQTALVVGAHVSHFFPRKRGKIHFA